MGSDANSTTSTSTDTNNLAVDAASTNGAGVQILDSIIVDPSDVATVKMIQEHRAAFEVLMTQGTFQLGDMLDLGEKVLHLVDSQAAQLNDLAYDTLKRSVDALKSAQAEGRFVMSVIQDVSDRSFDLADEVTDANSLTTARALDIVADVKTDSYAQTFTTATAFMAVFGIAAIWLTTRK